MSSSDAEASPERCRCDAYEVPNRSGALFAGDGKVHTWLLCQPTAGRTPSCMVQNCDHPQRDIEDRCECHSWNLTMEQLAGTTACHRDFPEDFS